MNVSEAAGLLHFAFLILGFWFLIVVCWRPFRIAKLRDELFELRGRLFAFAKEGGIEFSHPAYTGLRTDIDRMIRFAERVTFLRALLTWVCIPSSERQSDWGSTIKDIPLHTQKQLVKFRNEFDLIVAGHVIRLSTKLSTLMRQ